MWIKQPTSSELVIIPSVIDLKLDSFSIDDFHSLFIACLLHTKLLFLLKFKTLNFDWTWTYYRLTWISIETTLLTAITSHGESVNDPYPFHLLVLTTNTIYTLCICMITKLYLVFKKYRCVTNISRSPAT